MQKNTKKFDRICFITFSILGKIEKYEFGYDQRETNNIEMIYVYNSKAIKMTRSKNLFRHES